jgi:hypothetical protein
MSMTETKSNALTPHASGDTLAVIDPREILEQKLSAYREAARGAFSAVTERALRNEGRDHLPCRR